MVYIEENALKRGKNTIICFTSLIVLLTEVDLLSGEELRVIHISLLICLINLIEYVEMLFR